MTKKITKQRIQSANDLRLRKHSDIPAGQREREAFLERDLDGYVHTFEGFMPRSRYEQLLIENPGSGLPAWNDMPVMKPIDY